MSAVLFPMLLNELVIVTRFVWNSCSRSQCCDQIIFLTPLVNALFTSLSSNLAAHFPLIKVFYGKDPDVHVISFPCTLLLMYFRSS